MLQVPALDGLLDERYVFLGAQQYLDRLPSNEATKGQGWDGRGVEVVVGGLHGVLTAGYLPNVGYGGKWHIDK